MSITNEDAALAALAPAQSTHARSVRSLATLRGAAWYFLRFPTPRMLLASAAVLGAVRIVLGQPRLGDLAAFGCVAAVWPLVEWFLHSAVLHFRPRTIAGRRVDPLFARYHRYHHEHPWILERTFLPVPVLAVLLPINAAVFVLAMPTITTGLSVACATSLAALGYEWTHYLTHTPYRPRSRFYAAIQRHHLRHHFSDEEKSFAFLVPAIDRWLGTAEPPR
ncbi:MAG: sterol desaturase family protein [Polyangiaceae bacterium]